MKIQTAQTMLHFSKITCLLSVMILVFVKGSKAQTGEATDFDGCGSSGATLCTVNAEYKQPVIPEQNGAYHGQTELTYSIAPGAGANSYTWSATSESTIIGRQNTASIVASPPAVAFTCKEAGITEGFSELSLYPTPASASAILQLDGFAEGKAQLAVYDLVGNQLLYSDVKVVICNNEYKPCLTNYPKGVYTVRVVYNGVMRNSKLIVQ